MGEDQAGGRKQKGQSGKAEFGLGLAATGNAPPLRRTLLDQTPSPESLIISPNQVHPEGEV